MQSERNRRDIWWTEKDFKHGILGISVKSGLYEVIVMPTVLYGTKT